MDRLQAAIKAWYEASAAYDRAFAAYEGYSWGWAGHEKIEARQAAAEEFEAAMTEVIDRRVREQLQELTGDQT
ncbi:MAG: hypothetical protein GY938_30765 [Ketobacter sp.]|nr:hypothetical protein [Ketobacter sp.]